MDPKVLPLLWLVHVFTITAQGLVDLTVSPGIRAQCGSQVKLQCTASSSQTGLYIALLGWYHRNTQLCGMNVDSFNRSDHYCEYHDGQLSLIFPRLNPYQQGGDSEPYLCKLRSNKAVMQAYTTVELDDCAGPVSGVLTPGGPSCTFPHVHPDGDVHWFRGSNGLWAKLPSSEHFTGKSVEAGGWLTIHSNLKLSEKGSGVVYNCSLWSNRSEKYIASTLIQSEGLKGERVAKAASQSQNTKVRGSVTNRAPWSDTGVCLSVVFALLKIIS